MVPFFPPVTKTVIALPKTNGRVFAHYFCQGILYLAIIFRLLLVLIAASWQSHYPTGLAATALLFFD